jgi:hypothetical protein
MKRVTLLMAVLVALVTVLAAGCGSSGDRVGSSSRMVEKTYAPNIDPAAGGAHMHCAPSVGRSRKCTLRVPPRGLN